MTRTLSQASVLLVLGCSLVATAAAQRKALDQLPQDAEAITQAVVTAVPSVDSVVLPGKGRVRAIACGKSDLWLVRDEICVITVGDLLVKAKGPRKARRQLPVPEGLLGLAADDQFFYVLQKDAVAVMDANTGREERRIALSVEHDQDPVAIGAHGDELFISYPDHLLALHKTTTKTRECARLIPAPRWLASDGAELWSEARFGFARVDESRAVRRQTSRNLPMQFTGGLATFVGERLLVVKNQDAAGKRVAATFVDPQLALPVELLSIGLHLGAAGLRYEVGPKPLRTANAVTLELQRIRQDPSCLVPGPKGKRVPMTVMLVVYPGVTVAELAETWDLVTAAGFPDVRCISYKARPRPAEPPPPPPPPVRRKGR